MPTFQRPQIHNLAAGPSPLPTTVLQQAAEGLLNYNGTGIGVCELSHRGKEFKGIIEGAEADLKTLLQIPDTHVVLFTQGGGTTQFSSVVLNLLSHRRLLHPSSPYAPPTVDYVVTGSWSAKAFEEAKRLVVPTTTDKGHAVALADVRAAATTKASGYTTLPKREEYRFSEDPAFVYYCENETIHGIQFPADPTSPLAFPFDLVPASVPLVADYSSSFISRPIPHVERHALIYAGAQKNLGPSGTTVLIIRKDLLVDTSSAAQLGGVPVCPIQNEYKILADNKSLYNTPPVFAIYVSALVLRYLLTSCGGIEGVAKTNAAKAGKLYAAIERAEKRGTLKVRVREEGARSWMNVCFEVVDVDGEAKGEGEKRFVEDAEKEGFRQIKGHRSVGGIRASLYNAVTEETVDALVRYIDGF